MFRFDWDVCWLSIKLPKLISVRDMNGPSKCRSWSSFLFSYSTQLYKRWYVLNNVMLDKMQPCLYELWAFCNPVVFSYMRQSFQVFRMISMGWWIQPYASNTEVIYKYYYSKNLFLISSCCISCKTINVKEYII